MIQISDGKTSKYFRGTSLPCNNVVASNISCNKHFLRRLLKKENLPTPRTITLRHPAAWETILKSSMQFPLVVKPINASHANGSTLNITSSKELKQAVTRAFVYIKKHKRANRVLVEEYFTGLDLRFLVVGDHVASVVKREPAYVIGNGHSNIRQLIHAFNKQWRSPIKYDFPLCPIPLDKEVSRYMARSNLTLNSILSKGKKTYLRWNANVSTGGRTRDITNLTHPRLKNLAIQITKLSHLEVGGVDILCKDFTSGDISAKNISILEINDAPGFDIHHYPVSGVGQDVCTAILEHTFNESDHTEKPSANQIELLLKNIHLEHLTPVRQKQR